MMEDACNRYDKGIETIILENPDLYESFVNFPTTGFGSYTAILDNIQGKMYRDYPEVSNLDYNIVNINEEIANSGVAAYFNIPPIDDTGDKQLRVNPDIGGVDDIYTYSVVAHEGYPGHMYQNAMPMKIWIPPIARRWQTRRRTAKALPSMPNTPRFSTWMGSTQGFWMPTGNRNFTPIAPSSCRTSAFITTAGPSRSFRIS